MYTCCGIYDCAVDWVSLDPELLFESKMDATWYMPQSLHNLSCCESLFAASKAGAEAISVVDESRIEVDEADAIAVVDEGTIGVDEADAIAVVDEGTIGVDEADAIAVADEGSTSDRLAGARVEGRKTPHLLT